MTITTNVNKRINGYFPKDQKVLQLDRHIIKYVGNKKNRISSDKYRIPKFCITLTLDNAS